MTRIAMESPIDQSRTKKRSLIKPIAILAIIALCIAAPIVWHKQIRFRLSPKNFGVVEAGAIYRGAAQHTNVLRDLCQEHGIRTIVDLTGDNPEEDALCRELGITRYAIELPGDGRGDPGKWAAVCRILADRRHHPIFVHCAAGAQRTTTAVMLYRKYAQGRPFQESYPESFDFRHKAEEWELLAFVADHGEEIFAILDSGQISRDDETVPLAHLIDQARTTSAGRADE